MQTRSSLVAVMLAALAAFSSNTQAQVPAAGAEQRIVADVVRSRSNRIGGGDFDDKTDVISFTVKLTNSDTKAVFTDHKAEFYVWAQSIVEKKAFLLLTKDEWPLSLTPRGTQEFVSKEGKTMYDTTGVRFGAKYEAWVLVVRDAAGKVVMKKSTQPSWLPVVEQLKTLNEMSYYDRTLEPVKGVR